MSQRMTWLFAALLAAVCLVASPAGAAGVADVTHLSGTAVFSRPGATVPVQLEKGGTLAQGDTVSVGEDSRLELRLPDESRVRFDENTRFVLDRAFFNADEKQRDLNISMLLGKTWARVSGALGFEGRFQHASPSATVGVRGTTYRMNVEEDDSVVVKVYWGEVLVKGQQKASAKGKPAAPYVLSPPTPVSGPRPVSMEEWVKIVAAMQQIKVSPDGVPTEPESFSREEDATLEWVQWNRERDAALTY
ncbi:MAG: FecR domain-containing protein [Desulfatibacillaceae bacterium]